MNLSILILAFVGTTTRVVEGFDAFRNTLHHPVDEQRPFGNTLAISDDGNWLLVRGSHIYENIIDDFFTGTYVEMVEAGAVYLYHQIDNDWVLQHSLYGNATRPIGENIALNPNGKWLAVRRGNSHFEIYSIENNNTLAATFDGCEGRSIAMKGEWLIAGCDGYNEDLGMVRIFRYHGGKWILWAEIQGQQTGGWFGYSVALDIDYRHWIPGQFAVSSPFANQGRGMVRIFEVSPDRKDMFHILSQEDLIGEENFGFSIAYSSRVLAVGHPAMKNGGISFHQLNSYQEWVSLGDFSGTEEGKLGDVVGISTDGQKAAVSVINTTTSSTLAQFYHRSVTSPFQQVELIHGNDRLGMSGMALAISGPGSLLVSSSVEGKVQAFVDTSPFCGKGGSGDLTTFIERNSCRNDSGGLVSKDACSLTLGSVGTKFFICEWHERLSTESPTATPSSSPTGQNDVTSPSSVAPSVEQSPIVLTGRPSEEPSFSAFNQRAYGCPCDTDGTCTNTALGRNQSLSLCIYSEGFTIEAVDRLIIEQPGRELVLIGSSVVISNSTLKDCSSNFCLVTTDIPDAFFASPSRKASIRGTVLKHLKLRGDPQIFTFQISFALAREFMLPMSVGHVSRRLWIVAATGICMICLFAVGIWWLRKQQARNTRPK